MSYNINSNELNGENIIKIEMYDKKNSPRKITTIWI